MIGLDTNVLVRYLTDDEPVQSRKAAAAIRSTVARGDRCFISHIVLCELSWVLRGAYGVSRTDLLETLDRLMMTTQFVIGDKDEVRAAVESYRAGRADFADCLIGAINQTAGCRRTVTFDRRLKGQSHFQVL